MGFIENLILFLTVQKLWKSVHIWRSYHWLCNVLFLLTTVYFHFFHQCCWLSSSTSL